MIVIFMCGSKSEEVWDVCGYFLAAGGSSRIQGQTAIVWTLPFVFLITVIFMSRISS